MKIITEMLTLDELKKMAAATSPSRLKELARAREALVDFFIGPNQFKSTGASWRAYFLPFTYAARRNH